MQYLEGMRPSAPCSLAPWIPPPILVHDLVPAPRPPLRPDAEAGFVAQDLGEAIMMGAEDLGLQREHGEHHAARDVHADRVGDHRVVRGQDPADGVELLGLLRCRRLGIKRACQRRLHGAAPQITRLGHHHD